MRPHPSGGGWALTVIAAAPPAQPATPDSISHYYFYLVLNLRINRRATHAQKELFFFSFAPTFYNSAAAAGPSKNAIYRADVASAFCFGHVLICGASRWIASHPRPTHPPPPSPAAAMRLEYLYTFPPHRLHISPTRLNFSPGPSALTAECWASVML